MSTEGEKKNFRSEGKRLKKASCERTFERCSQGLIALEAHISKHSQAIFESRKLGYYQIIKHWDKFLGPYACETTPLKLSLRKDNRYTLYILVSSGSIIPVLEYEKSSILSNISQLYGHNRIDRILFHQGQVYRGDYGRGERSDSIISPSFVKQTLTKEKHWELSQLIECSPNEELRSALSAFIAGSVGND